MPQKTIFSKCDPSANKQETNARSGTADYTDSCYKSAAIYASKSDYHYIDSDYTHISHLALPEDTNKRFSI